MSFARCTREMCPIRDARGRAVAAVAPIAAAIANGIAIGAGIGTTAAILGTHGR